MRTIKDWLCNDSHLVCVGYNSKSGLYTIYNAETEVSNDVPESVLAQGILRRGIVGTILNLKLDLDGKVQTTSVPKEDMEHHSMIAIGIVNNTRKVKDIVGYDMVLNTGVKIFVDLKRAVEYASSGLVHNMTAKSKEDKKPAYKPDSKLMYVRYMEDEQSEDEKQKRLEELKEQLISVLTQMDAIRPVQFHDIDCDDCIYNFSDVVIDSTDDRVYIELAMWHDNLPAHAENPLKDGHGREILPQRLIDS